MALDKEMIGLIKQSKALPDTSEVNEEKPVPEADGIDKTNCFELDGKLVEVHPTKLKYFRNNTVSFYHVIDTVPLPTIYQMNESNAGIDGDKAILTFLCAVFDDVKFAERIYRKLDAGQLLEIVRLFKKVNGIDVREENQKNARATRGKE